VRARYVASAKAPTGSTGEATSPSVQDERARLQCELGRATDRMMGTTARAPTLSQLCAASLYRAPTLDIPTDAIERAVLLGAHAAVIGATEGWGLGGNGDDLESG
jgi:hypothetical protein